MYSMPRNPVAIDVASRSVGLVNAPKLQAERSMEETTAETNAATEEGSLALMCALHLDKIKLCFSSATQSKSNYMLLQLTASINRLLI